VKPERYFSVDIESSGPIPGRYSMLSLGACVVGNPGESFYVELKPISADFVPEALKVSGLDLAVLERDGRSPEEAMPAFRCQWTRILTRLLNPNCYEVWGSDWRGGLLPDLPGFSVVSPIFAFVAGSCRFLPGPTGCQGFGPRSLRAPAFSTLGFPHDRWSLEPGSPRPRRSPRHRGRPLQVHRDWTQRPRSSTPRHRGGPPKAAATGRINRCTRPVPPRRLLGRRWARDQALLPTCSPSP
jgi:hypothetical protein